jgi:hypothetical protein
VTWWRRRKSRRAVGYPRVRFEVAGDSLVPREWVAAGRAGPLEWHARLERSGDGVDWSLEVAGTLTGAEVRTGRAANQYAAGDECKAALRGIIDDHNAFTDVTSG